MDYHIYKLSFKTPVHFGNGRLSGTLNTIYADTLFSALCKEALKLYDEHGIDVLYSMAKRGNFIISDAMPYYNDILFIPKPITTVQSDKQGDSTLKKKFKNLKYISVNDIDLYLSGNYVPSEISFGKEDLRTCVKVNDNDDNEPFNIGIYQFGNPEALGKYGLYFIIGTTSKEDVDFLNEIIKSLSYTGIGGKVTSGLGKFTFTCETPSEQIVKRFNNNSNLYMSLSISMANDNELPASLENACYELIKRSGFVSSETYSDTPLKKRDFYCFKGGSCFKNKFMGDIFDVSTNNTHPVYRYAKPFFIGL